MPKYSIKPYNVAEYVNISACLIMAGYSNNLFPSLSVKQQHEYWLGNAKESFLTWPIIEFDTDKKYINGFRTAQHDATEINLITFMGMDL